MRHGCVDPSMASGSVASSSMEDSALHLDSPDRASAWWPSPLPSPALPASVNGDDAYLPPPITLVDADGGPWKESALPSNAGGTAKAAISLNAFPAGPEPRWVDLWALPEEPSEVDPGEYGVDTLAPAYRRPENWIAVWMVVALLAAVGINMGAAVANSHRQQGRRAQLAGIPMWPTERQQRQLPPTAAQLQQPAQQRKGQVMPQQGVPPRLARSPPPPSPPRPRPPPANCSMAPPNLQRDRFSDLKAEFPADEDHYWGNIIEGQAPSDATQARYPAYYNGVEPRNCIIRVYGIYTCLKDDLACNRASMDALNICEAACTNTAGGCRFIENLDGHPLQQRACALLGNARPSCSALGWRMQGQRTLLAFYKLNLCMAPPKPSAPPSPQM